MKAPTLLLTLGLLAGMQLTGVDNTAIAAEDAPPEAAADKPATDGAMVSDPVSAGTSATDNGKSIEKASPNPIDELGPKLAKKLQELESHFFGHLYVTDEIEKRIVRLERFVFGTESGGPFLTRIEHIASSLNLTDPDGTKREVKLSPKQQPKAEAPAAATAAQDPPAAEANGETVAPGSEPPVPQLSDLTKTQAIAPKPAESPDEKVLPPQMEVTPVLGSTPRKIAEISTAVVDEKPRGPVLQVTKDFFSTVGKPSEIIKELDMAIRVHPNDPELMFERGKAYIQLNKYNTALNDLSDAIMNQPNKSAYYIARAFCYKNLGNSYLAADDVKQAHFVDPSLPPQVDFVLSGK